jgi:hypothetical protein
VVLVFQPLLLEGVVEVEKILLVLQEVLVVVVLVDLLAVLALQDKDIQEVLVMPHQITLQVLVVVLVVQDNQHHQIIKQELVVLV